MHARDALVLVYHGILSEVKVQPFCYHHTVEEFEAHLDWLGGRCTPVSLADFVRWRGGEWQPGKPPVLITFDDGYLNNFAAAAPILKRKGFPALFFLASGYIDGRTVLWPDEVFARICAWPDTSIDGPDGSTRNVPERRSERAEFALSVVEACKNCNDSRRHDFIAYLARETPQCETLMDREAQAFMSWDDARALAADGFDLGSHSMTHPILAQTSPEELRRELRESRATIEAQTGVRCTTLAYPNGRSQDVGARTLIETAQAGYDFAFTVSNRWCRRTSQPLQLDRIGPPGSSDLATFALYASGVRRWFPS